MVVQSRQEESACRRCQHFKWLGKEAKESANQFRLPTRRSRWDTNLQCNPFKDSKNSLLGYRRSFNQFKTWKEMTRKHVSVQNYEGKSKTEANRYYLNCILKFVPFSLKSRRQGYNTIRQIGNINWTHVEKKMVWGNHWHKSGILIQQRERKNVVVICVCFHWKKGRTRTHNSQGNSTHFRRIIHNILAKNRINQTDWWASKILTGFRAVWVR